MKSRLIFVVAMLTPFVVFLSLQSMIEINSFAENASHLKFVFSNTSVFQIEPETSSPEHGYDDNVPPSVNITYPFYPPTITTGKIIIEGTANDSSGIHNVSIAAHSFPFKGEFLRPLTSHPVQIFLSNLGRLNEDRFTKYYYNKCAKEYPGSPSITYENPNEEVFIVNSINNLSTPSEKS